MRAAPPTAAMEIGSHPNRTGPSVTARIRAATGALRRRGRRLHTFGQHEEVRIRGEDAEVLAGSVNEQRVTGARRHVAQSGSMGAPLAPDREHHQAVLPAEAELAEGLPYEPGVGCEDDLGDPYLLGLQNGALLRPFGLDLELPESLQCGQPFGPASYDQQVPRLQALAGLRHLDGSAFAADADHPQPQSGAQSAFLQRLARQEGVAGHSNRKQFVLEAVEVDVVGGSDSQCLVCAQVFDLVRRTLDQQRVGGLKQHILQGTRQRPPVAPDRHHANPEANAEVHVAKRPSRQLGAAGYADLRDFEFGSFQHFYAQPLFLDIERGTLTQPVQPIHWSLNDDAVSLQETEVRAGRGSGSPVPDDGDGLKSGHGPEPDLAEALSSEGRGLGQSQDHEPLVQPIDVRKHPFIVSSGTLDPYAALRQQPGDGHEDEDEARRHHEQSHRRVVEESERFETLVAERLRYQNVGRGADEGGQSTQEARVREGQKKPRGRDPGLLREIHDDGQEDRRHAHVVHEGRRHAGGRHDHQDDAGLASARKAYDLAPDQVGYSGVRESAAQHEDGPDGHVGRIGEPGKRRGRFDEPGHGKEHEREERDQVHSESPVHEQDDVHHQNGQNENEVQRHQPALQDGESGLRRNRTVVIGIPSSRTDVDSSRVDGTVSTG